MYGSNCCGYGSVGASYSIGPASLNLGSYSTNCPASYGSSSTAGYNPNTYSARNSYQTMEKHSNFIAEQFLSPLRPATPIVQGTNEIMPLIERAFEHCTGTPFPKDSISIVLCTPEQFKSLHEQTGSFCSPGVLGFSFNRYGRGVSEIFVKMDYLDSLMLTIGHEIGHVMSPTLPNPQDEEAKAFAWSLAWMEKIREHDIGNLAMNIMPNPAQNGLHDVAFDFVKYLLSQGKNAMEIFNGLSKGLTSHLAKIETISLEV